MPEAGWCDLPDKDWESFRIRLEKGLQRLDASTWAARLLQRHLHFDREASYPREVELELDYPGAEIHYTLDGSAPTASPRYTAPLSVEKGTIRACGFRPEVNLGTAVENNSTHETDNDRPVRCVFVLTACGRRPTTDRSPSSPGPFMSSSTKAPLP